MSSNIIEVKNVHKTFKVREKSSNFREIFFPKHKKIVAVDDISFNVKKGEILIDNINFGYSSDKTIFKNFSLTIKPKQD